MLAALLLLALPQALERVVETFPSGKVHVERHLVRRAGQEVLHGPFVRYYENGKREARGEYENGLRTGPWEFRWENGRIRERGEFVQDEKHGLWTTYHSSSRQKASEGHYLAGMRAGEWSFWNADGQLDQGRSGSFRTLRELWPSGVARVEGEMGPRVREGRWVYRWPNGARQYVTEYVGGEPSGPRFFFHRDDRLDESWITTPAAPVPSWVERLAADMLLPSAPWESSAAADEAVRAFLASSGPVEGLGVRGRPIVPALLNALEACDLSMADGLARAVRLHSALCWAHAGRGWPWDAQQARLLVERWNAAWFLLRDAEDRWSMDLDPSIAWLDLDFDQTSLASPPLPDQPRVNFEGLGAGAGGPLVGRPGGRRILRARKNGLEKPLSRIFGDLLDAQGENGCWHSSHDEEALRSDAWALLVLTGDGHGLYAGLAPHVRRAVRHLVELQGPDGAFGGSEGHLLATWALMEVDHFSGDRGPRRAVRAALEHLPRLQNEDGSFTGPRGPAATTAIAAFLLPTARERGFEVGAMSGRVQAWLDARAAAVVAAGTSTPGDRAVVGSALWMAVVGGRSLSDLKPLSRYLEAHPLEPRPDPDDLVLATWGAYQVGRPLWPVWEAPLVKCLTAEPGPGIEAQARQACAIQVYYRYSLMAGVR